MGRRFVLALVALAAASSPAAAQATGKVWVPLVAGVPQGKPAEITLDTQGSSTQVSVVDVRIYGFWKQDVVVSGQTWQRLEVPGLPLYERPGAPELPVARFKLAIPTNAGEVKLATAMKVGMATVPNLNVYPQPLPGDDEDFDPTEDPGPGNTVGTSEQFQPPDPTIYGLTANWPTTTDTGSYTPRPLFGSFMHVAVQAHPVFWNPTTKSLEVDTHLKLTYAHAGTVGAALSVPKPEAMLAPNTFVNWTAGVSSHWLTDLGNYDARYLIVTLDAYVPALKPLIDLKKQQGFQVLVESQPGPWSYLAAVGVIADFYADGGGDGSGMEHYALLVGESDEIPLAHYFLPVQGGSIEIPTDDLYGSLGLVNTDEKVFVGRLSVDSVADLQRQVAKVVAYQVSPEPGGGYNRALLVAHLQDAPGKYQGCQEAVRTQLYSHPPVFLTEYGAAGATNMDVSDDINADVGLVCYRGHGSTGAWAPWNLAGEQYHKNDVIALLNHATQPIVWAITCTNGNVEWSNTTNADCIAEAWMEADDVGGAASYGATITTSTGTNNDLDKALFLAVYSLGITTHAQAIAASEEAVESLHPGNKNVWAYLLLGDPAMKIRRDVPPQWSITAPSSLDPCDVPVCGTPVVISAKSVTGAPLPGALVSLWKPSAIPGAPDEVFTNAYANAQGFVTLLASPLTPGPLHVCVQDDFGGLAMKLITVPMHDAWTDLGHALKGSLGAPSLVGLGPLTAGSASGVLLTNALPQAPAVLCVGFTTINAPFKGGVWVPQTNVVVSGLSTGATGSIHLPVTWPAGVPSGFQFNVQFWMVDAGGPKGFAASNAVRATTP